MGGLRVFFVFPPSTEGGVLRSTIFFLRVPHPRCLSSGLQSKTAGFFSARTAFYLWMTNPPFCPLPPSKGKTPAFFFFFLARFFFFTVSLPNFLAFFLFFFSFFFFFPAQPGSVPFSPLFLPISGFPFLGPPSFLQKIGPPFSKVDNVFFFFHFSHQVAGRVSPS